MIYIQPGDISLIIIKSSSDSGGSDSNLAPQNPSQFTDKANKSSNSGGNGITVVSSVIGILLGATIGYFISAGVVGLFIVILCTVGGGFLGGAVGTYLGEFFKKGLAERRKGKN